jgi:hypothetical protein
MTQDENTGLWADADGKPEPLVTPAADLRFQEMQAFGDWTAGDQA